MQLIRPIFITFFATQIADLLAHFQNKGFISILVNFDIPDHILQARVATSQRSITVFRSASTFDEVLTRQQAESHKGDVAAPIEDEADHFFVIKNSEEVQSVTQKLSILLKVYEYPQLVDEGA